MTPYSEKEREEAMRAVEAMMMAHPGSSAIAGYNNAAIALYMQNRRMRDALDCARIALELSRKTLIGAGGGDMPTLNRVIDMAREALAGGDGK